MFKRAAVGVSCFITFLGGCNTDPVWEPRQRADAPTTSIRDPEGVNVPDLHIADAHEADLVEQVLMYRATYHRSLEALRDYYAEHGYDTKRTWASNELSDLQRIRPYRYLLSAEVPADALTASDSIAEADALYARGLELLEQGGHSVPAFYREGKMREALRVFRRLIEQYPSSDKIDDAAFYCGEIHKEYFSGEERIAVRWYERAFTWDPKTPHPARFQAAAVYDLRLHDRDRALELYHDVLQQETFNQSNVNFAVRRIEELAREREPANPRNRQTSTDDGRRASK